MEQNQNLHEPKKTITLESLKESHNRKLPLTSDIVFKKVFSQNGNEHILKSLLEAILNIKINNIVVLNPEMPKNLYDSKAGILDVKAELDDNTIVDIEMQMSNSHNIDKRSTFYMSTLVAESLHSGELYNGLKKVIVINILNFNYYNTNNYHNIAHMKFEEDDPSSYVDMGFKQEDTIATKYIEMHFIELPKFLKKNPEANSMLEKWLWFISGKENKIDMEEKENKVLKETSKIVNRMSMTKEEWDAYVRHFIAEMDYYDGMKYATETGLSQGLSQGISQGMEKNKKETAIRMLNMNMDENTICEALDITHEELENIKKNMNENT